MNLHPKHVTTWLAISGCLMSTCLLVLTPCAVVARAAEAAAEAGGAQGDDQQPPRTGRDTPAESAHPLLASLKRARAQHDKLVRSVRDYTAIFVKRERVEGRLRDYEYLSIKVRHRQTRSGRVIVPFSVYIEFLGPARLKGREVIYVEGRNDGKLLGHDRVDSLGGKLVDYVLLDPRGAVAMIGNRHPITEMGIENLARRLIQVGEEDLAHDECTVVHRQGAKVDGRTCTSTEVRHPVRRDHFRYHLARVYVDDRWQMPIRFEAYDWPEEQGGEPVLVEEYTYRKLQFNVGLRDADFDPDNPQYRFVR